MRSGARHPARGDVDGHRLIAALICETHGAGAGTIPPVRRFFVPAALAALSCAIGCPTPASSDGGEGGEGEGEGEEGEGEGEGEDLGCASSTDTGFPAPLTSITDRLGSPTTFDVGAWNIRNFPRAGVTVSTVADILASMDLDLVAVAEIEDEAAFSQLMRRLPDHEGVLSSHTYSTGGYQKLGFVFRCGLLRPIGPPQLPFLGDGFNFPRPPLQQRFRYDSGATSFEFTAIAVHFKANEGGSTDPESAARRRTAFERLEAYVHSLVTGNTGTDEVLVLGDFNERLDDTTGRVNWQPFLNETRYVVRSRPLVGEASFLSSTNALIDHIVTTRAFDDEVGAGSASVVKLDQDILNYRELISDHRPVTLIMRGVD